MNTLYVVHLLQFSAVYVTVCKCDVLDLGKFSQPGRTVQYIAACHVFTVQENVLYASIVIFLQVRLVVLCACAYIARACTLLAAKRRYSLSGREDEYGRQPTHSTQHAKISCKSREKAEPDNGEETERFGETNEVQTSVYLP